MINIRYAENNDLQNLMSLMNQLGYPQENKDFKKRFELYGTLEDYGIAVALDNGIIIVGFIAWSKSYLIVSSKVLFHIEGIAVDNKYRGLGIGRKLIKFVEDIAKIHAPCIIDLVSGVRRAKDGTHEFYKTLGYCNDGEMAKLYLRKEL